MAILGYGALVGVTLGVADYSGGFFGSFKEEDAMEQREYMKAHRRRPMEETIAEIGEGRGPFRSLEAFHRIELFKADRICRNPSSGIRRAKEGEDKTEIWHRCTTSIITNVTIPDE